MDSYFFLRENRKAYYERGLIADGTVQRDVRARL